MGNVVEYECRECHYWDAIHGIDGYDYHQEQFKKCSHCTFPLRSRLEGHGIYEAYLKSKEAKHGTDSRHD